MKLRDFEMVVQLRDTDNRLFYCEFRVIKSESEFSVKVTRADVGTPEFWLNLILENVKDWNEFLFHDIEHKSNKWSHWQSSDLWIVPDKMKDIGQQPFWVSARFKLLE